MTHNRSGVSRETAISSVEIELPREASTAHNRRDLYAMHPLFTYFLDSDIEEAFVRFHFVDSGCYGGKAYCFLVFGLSVFMTIVFPSGGKPSAESMGSWQILPMFVVGCVALLLFGVVVLPTFERWREHVILLTVFLHWPAYIISVFAGKDPDVYNYSWGVGCLFFCCLVALPRFWTMLITLLVGPLATLAGLTFGLRSHFAHYSHMEIVFWPFIGFAVATHRVFEIRARKSFAVGHRARAALQQIDAQIALTQDIIARYFPPTPTSALLSSGRGTNMPKTVAADTAAGSTTAAASSSPALHRTYAAAALVVTDLKGFTSFASQAEPALVIQAISAMFNKCDAAAERLRVEKVSTVGDSYFAAVFAPLTGTDTARKADQRVVTAVQFAFTIVAYAPEGLGMRVGLHCGDVEGGFVGTTPPKFDLFGPTADRCKELEQTGEANKVHISNAAAQRALRHLDLIINRLGTEYDAQLWTPQQLSIEYDLNLHSPHDDDTTMDADRASACDDRRLEGRVAACRALLSLTAQDDAVPSAATSNYHVNAPDPDDADALPDDVSTDFYKINYALLEFSNAGTELKYQLHYARTGATGQVTVLASLLLAYVVLCCDLLMCADSIRNRLVVLCLWAGVAAVSAHAFAVNVRRVSVQPWIVTGVMSAMILLMWLVPTADCSYPDRDRSIAVYHLGNVSVVIFDILLIIDQLWLSRTFKARCLISLVETAAFYALVAIRIAIYDDGVGVWTWIGLVGFLAHGLSSYALELIERLAFTSARKLQETMRSAKGAEAAEASRALDIMLPRFASDRLMNRRDGDSTGANEDESHGDDGRSEVSTGASEVLLSDNTSLSVAGTKLRGLHVTWDFDFVAIMFVYIGGEAGASAATMNATVKAIEAALLRHGAVKIKSNGPCVLCAAGMQDGDADGSSEDRRVIGSREESACGLMRAAAEIARTALHGRVESWSIGVHGGPCFGGIFGTQGVMFDVFGDTVNSASRFASTAEPCTVACSATIKALVDAGRSAGAEAPAFAPSSREVLMKGLGRVVCHTVLTD